MVPEDENVIYRSVFTNSPACIGTSDTLVKNGFHNIYLVDARSFMVSYCGNYLILDEKFSIEYISKITTRGVIIEKCVSNKKTISIPNMVDGVIWSRPISMSTRRFSSLQQFKKFINNNNDKVCFLLVDTRYRYEEASKIFSGEAIFIRMAMVECESYLP